MIYVIWFERSSFSIKADNQRYKRALFSDLNITKDVLLKTYFANRHCIKYSDIQKPFRFGEQPGQIDTSGKLRIVVSINALNSLTNRYQEKIYRSFPLQFLVVS